MKKQFLQLCALTFIALTAVLCKTDAQYWKLAGNGGTTDTNYIGTTGLSPLIFKTKKTERMRITKTGSVGIGIINPASILNVVSGETVTLTKPGILTLGDVSGPNMSMDDSMIQARNAATAAPLYLNYYGGTTYLGPSGVFQISDAGKTTIGGTTTLSGNLIFTAGTQSIQFANPGISPAPMMYMFSSGTTNTSRMVIAHSPSYPTWGLQYNDVGDQFDFLGSGTSRMSINLSNGNVGIGVTSAVYKLEVCGTIRAKEVRVETGWCDYVFEKNYNLRSLDELEKYINENKHLPGITSASEIEKEGLKIGETNKAMMEKIEELTLYVIQLGKENKRLQDEIDTLKK